VENGANRSSYDPMMARLLRLVLELYPALGSKQFARY
jgi:hypothetical protein